MSEHESLENDRLTAAIEDNPEAVAAFVERLDAVNELLDVIELGQAAMNDEMATELSQTATLLAESADGLATPETVQLADRVGENGADLASALETVVELERAGTLDDLAEAAGTISLARAALDDDMVTALMGMGSGLGELADSASEPATVDGLATLLTAVGEASDADEPPARLGMIGLLRALRDPEVKRGLGFVVQIAAKTGQELDRQSSQRP
ncbi:MAG: DUF1641 domain-containing protein [Halobacteriales archaeon]